MFPPKKYDIETYNYIKDLLASIRTCYNSKKSKEANGINVYEEVKRLEAKYDSEVDTKHNDTNFCLKFLLQIMSIIKHQPHLFIEEVW